MNAGFHHPVKPLIVVLILTADLPPAAVAAPFWSLQKV
jgi:hypothetical protein